MLGVFNDNAINCIRAVGDINGDIHSKTNYGFAASEDVVRHFGRHLTASADYLRNYIQLDPAIQFSALR